MGVKGWFQKLGNKLFNTDKVVDQKVKERLGLYDNKEVNKLLVYREKEYATWAKGNADSLLEFYKLNNQYYNVFNTQKQQYWTWVGGVNTQKLHYPASTAILNSMKSLIFGKEPEIEFKTDDENERVEKEYAELNERMWRIFDDNNLSDFFQNAAFMESYSGTIAVKISIDKAISDYPIWQLYPQERIELGTKYGRVVEIRFKDYYTVKKKRYVLKSIYGYGYIDYILLNEVGKEVPLNTIPELADLEPIQFKERIMLAAYKKNRSNNAEFPDTAYGGSDFEGLIDIFHQIDEVYSTMAYYIRNTRPITTVTENLLPTTDNGRKHYVPQAWGFDLITLKKDQDVESIKGQILRDSPEIKLEPYINAIRELLKAAYQRLGYSNTTSNLDGIGANLSGNALQELEKSTLILYQNKVELWKAFIPKLVRLSLIWDDIMNYGNIVSDYSDYHLSVVFADYHDETTADRIETYTKAYQNHIIDLYNLHKKVWGDELTEDEIKTMTINVKLENGIPLTDDEMEFISETKEVDN